VILMVIGVGFSMEQERWTVQGTIVPSSAGMKKKSEASSWSSDLPEDSSMQPRDCGILRFDTNECKQSKSEDG